MSINQSSAISNYVQIIAEKNKFVSNHLRSKRFCGHVE